MIEEMYAASREGVPIDLIVRGICCLRQAGPVVARRSASAASSGASSNARAYRFINGGNEEIYLGSADLMNRNLDRRVEVLFPIEDERIKERLVREILGLSLSDNVKMRWLQMNRSYERPRTAEEKAFNLEYLLEPALIG